MDAWVSDGVQLVHTSALAANCRESARRLVALADEIDRMGDGAIELRGMARDALEAK